MSTIDLSAALNATESANSAEATKQKRKREKKLPFPSLPDGKRFYHGPVSVNPETQSVPPNKLFLDDLDYWVTQREYGAQLATFSAKKVAELETIPKEQRVETKKTKLDQAKAAAALKSKAVRDEFAKNPLATVEILKAIGAKPEALAAIQAEIQALLSASLIQ